MTDSTGSAIRSTPLVGPNVDLRDFAFMPLDVARLRDSELTANETPEACWAAVLLWAASWHQVPAASVPNDDKWLARAAGYSARGKVDPAWKRVRDGALHGFVECSDGRLYHAVVAEKALDAWQAKLRQRWKAECARIRKHNERHEGANVPSPSFDAWVAGGCRQGDPLPGVTCDTLVTGKASHAKTDSKGQGQGQGQGEREGQGKKEKAPRKRAGASAEPTLVSAEGLTADGVSATHAAQWLRVRKDKALPLTLEAWAQTKDEAAKAGLTPAEAVKRCCAEGWAGFRASWLATDRRGREPAPGAAETIAGAAALLGFAPPPAAAAVPLLEGANA